MTEYKTKVGYYPPIELHYEEPVWDAMNKAAEEVVANIRNDTDRMVIGACMKVGVSVDKDELVRALRYDRGQYEKGYADGSLAAAAEVEFFKKRICEFCGVTTPGSADPDNCEISGHGVWVELESGLTYYKHCGCSICGHRRTFKPDEVPKFCEECGSKMAPLILDRKETTNGEV